MPDYPYVYETGGPRAVAPGGTRVRVLRRRREEDTGQSSADDREEGSGGEGTWRELLERAVAELNRAFLDAGVSFHCRLEEDEQGLCLHVQRQGEDGMTEEVEEEVLQPSELPNWLARFRTRLGILVDETA